MNKRLTRVLSLIMVLAMFLSVSVPAFALEDGWDREIKVIGDSSVFADDTAGDDENAADEGEPDEGWDREISEGEIREFNADPDNDDPDPKMELFAENEERGYSVTVEAPMGALPTLAELRAEPVEIENIIDAVGEVVEGEPNVLVALDISFWLGEDEIEPEEPVQVIISAPELEGRKNLTLVHLPEEDEPEAIELIDDEDLAFELGTNEICFQSKDFSVYAVVEDGDEGDKARIEVNFYNLAKQTTPIATVYVKNGDLLLADGQEKDETKTYINDIVYDPGVGETLEDGFLFLGWSLDVTNVANYTDTEGVYVGSAYDTETDGVTIPDIRQFLDELTITEGDVLNVYAMVFRVFNVTFEDSKGTVLASDVLLMPVSQTTIEYTVNETYSNIDDTHHFEGWHVKTGADNISGASAAEPYPQGTTMTLSGNVTFSTVVSEGHWLVFEENGYGATYNAPVFVKSEEKASAKRPDLSQSANMHRSGYDFDNWYVLKQGQSIVNGDKDPNGNIDFTKPATLAKFEVYDFDQTLNDKVVLYAKWDVAASTKYTVIVWKQSVADDKNAEDADKTYDYAFSVEVTGATPLTAISALDLSAYQNKDGGSVAVNGKTYSFKGFKYNTTQTAKNTGEVTVGNGVVARNTVKNNSNADSVNPNGTTVVNLYYDRELVTYNFYVYEDGGYVFTPTTSSGEGYYYIPDGYGGYTRTYLYYYNGNYYTNRHLGWGWVYYDSEIYSGPRYDRHYEEGGYKIRETYTGLYEQKLEKYDYDWPTDLRWFLSQDGNRFISVQDMFNSSWNDNPPSPYTTNFYGKSFDSDTYVYHYLQNVDGSWPTRANFPVPTVIGNGMVFREFQGFTASEFRIKLPSGVNRYSTGTSYNGNNLVNPTYHNAVNGWTDWLPYGTGVEYNGNDDWHEIGVYGATAGGIEFRYTRDVANLTYMPGRFLDNEDKVMTMPASIPNELKQVTGIPYDSPMTDYAEGGSKYYNPDTATVAAENYKQDDFVFVGWYIDETCTTEAEFDGTMPLNGMTVYGKWKLKEYRVFLHPNAGTDTTLDWGSESQKTCFKVANGKKISVPTGKRTGYEFLGWYTDEAMTVPYTADARLNDVTVPAVPVYDKTVDMTENSDHTDIDKWGHLKQNDPGFNKDVDRPWVERKLDLYAKWSKVIIGADGIGVIYDANGGSNAPHDTQKYKDNIDAVAQAASTAPAPTQQNPELLTFDCWVMQRWDEAQGKYVDVEGSRIYPGDSFTVLLDNARKVANDDNTAEHPSYTYTIQLRANYVSKDQPEPTHITWHANNNTGDKMDSPDVPINETIQIPVPKAEISRADENVYVPWNNPADASEDLVWEDHVFLGWARLEETEGMAENIELGEDDLFLKYDYTSKKYQAKIDGNWKNVKYVAADEFTPYHTMYAVWAKVFYIYHTGNNTVEKVTITNNSLVTESVGGAEPTTVRKTNTVNLAARVPEGFLYGGAFKAYDGVSQGFDVHALTWTDTATDTLVPTGDASLNSLAGRGWLAKTADTGAKAYTDESLSFVGKGFYSGTSFGNGLEAIPEAGAVYYLKEVPADNYLIPYLHYTFYSANDKIGTAWLVSDTDDYYYLETGFLVTHENGSTERIATMYSEYTVTCSSGGKTQILKPTEVFNGNHGDGVNFTSPASRGYLTIARVINGSERLIQNGDKIQQYWVTPDGLLVTGKWVRTIDKGFGENDVYTDIASNKTDSAEASVVYVHESHS